ncbi:MAG: cardiolipin synthase [Oscillospiraceae bacterium]|nr:cardiolipin synthase [Oscillospiraceae bacterium]
MFGKFIRGLFSQLTIVSLLLVAQIALFIWVVQGIYSRYITAPLYLLSAVIVIHIINRESNSDFKLAWVVPIVLFPVFGGLFYLLLKLQRPTKEIADRLSGILAHSTPAIAQDPAVLADAGKGSVHFASCVRYINDYAHYSLVTNTSVRYFPMGDDVWLPLLRALESAKSYIFLEFFILTPGQFYDSVLSILRRKASEGVDVRILYDSVGSISTLPWNYPEKIEESGIRCRVFNPFIPVLSVAQNNRDHRKIVVVDGRIAFNGGFNLADEYVNRIERFGRWKDSGVMLEGDGAYNFAVMFLQMWELSARESVDYESFRPQPRPAAGGSGYVLPYGDYPLDNENVGEFVYLEMINNATDYLWFTTPYLIPDDILLSALKFAAKRGVDVRVIVPAVPDKWYVYYVTESYCAALLEAGIKVYKYAPGFIHSKSMISDDEAAVVGSINFDYRSLYLHYECATMLYKCDVLADIRRDFEETFPQCVPATLEEYRSANIFKRSVRAGLRLLAPLM